MRKKPATVRIARWSATHPWSAIGLWVVFVALCLLLGGAAGSHKISDEESGVGESGRAGRITAAGDFPEKPEENVLITAEDGRTFDAGAAREAAQDLSRRMRSLPEVEDVAPAVPSPDGRALLVTVTMKGDTENADQRVQPLLDAGAATERAHDGLRIDEVGTGSTAKGLGEALGEDFVKAELISLPLTLLILLVVFGAVIAAGVPVVLALSCVGAATGLSALASHVLPETSAVSSIILLMGMAVGVDYSLFYLKREREERQKGATPLDAVEIAAKTSGHTVVVSGTTVIVAMAGLYLADEATFASLATGSIIVVAVAVLASLTVLPALLAKLGRWVDRPRVPFLWRLTMRSGDSKLWPVLLRPALVRPVLTLVVSVGALLLLALPALDMRLKQPGSDDLSRDIPVVRAMDRLTGAFPGKGTVHQVAVRAPADRADEVGAALDGLLERTAGDDLFAHDRTPVIRASADGRVHTVQVGTPHSPRSDGARDSLELLRTWVPQAMEGVPGAESAVGGKVAQGVDFTGHLKDRMPWVVGFVLLLTFVTMAGIFRSPAVALSAILLNLLSAAASFGVLVAIFQHTWAEDLLDFHSSGAVVSWLPLFLFVVLFGLSMDYHVFVVSRIREAARKGANVRDAVREGITRSAGVVTSAAIVMVGVFAIFGTLSMVEFKQLGVGLAAAILLDAVVIRVFVLPALMIALGRWNWWPTGPAAGRRDRPAVGPDDTLRLRPVPAGRPPSAAREHGHVPSGSAPRPRPRDHRPASWRR
ncbi:MMPL family transporter [Streptomyces prasinopilosus]|uniref:Putative drug exporter of the RND superfamily n=1 Tax=Streptomyces prasinopilosus TaxID=67344 RepID=A0A1G6XDE2_9ACTN|nr:MMPL family transporter [Streptomyces prasinopilosus]SDD75793.1 putative drug exporter of the RND superfamily [Streptomyces prasinopilosus]